MHSRHLTVPLVRQATVQWLHRRCWLFRAQQEAQSCSRMWRTSIQTPHSSHFPKIIKAFKSECSLYKTLWNTEHTYYTCPKWTFHSKHVLANWMATAIQICMHKVHAKRTHILLAFQSHDCTKAKQDCCSFWVLWSEPLWWGCWHNIALCKVLRL